MKIILALVGLAAVAIALEHQVNPPQPAVLVDVPNASAPPAHDLELGHD